MKIIPIENKGLDRFDVEQQHQLRDFFGLDDTWCGTIESAEKIFDIYSRCHEDIDLVLFLMTSEVPGIPSTAKLYRDEYLGAFVLKSKTDADDLEMKLVTTIHKVYTNLMAANRQTDFMRAMGLKMIRVSDYDRLTNSASTALSDLCSLEHRVRELELKSEENTDKKEPGEACSST